MRRWATCMLLAVLGCGDDGAAAPDAIPIAPDAIGISVFDAYGAAWNEADDIARERLLEHSAVDELVVVEPTRTLDSRDAVSVAIEEWLDGTPGGSVVIDGNLREAHARAWLKWNVRDAQGTSIGRGTDLMTIAADGRIERVHSFFGSLPAPGVRDAVQQGLLDAFNEPDPTARLADLDIAVTDDVRFAIENEPSPRVGRAALATYIAELHTAVPGRVTEATTGYLTVPAAWYGAVRVMDGATEISAGVLLVRLATDGRIADAVMYDGLEP